MQDHIKQWVEIAARGLPMHDPIYEFGALQVPGQESYADLRRFFPGHTYVGADLRAGPGVDRILDLHHIDLPDGSAGTVLCLETLEHVEYPHQALIEIHRILAPGGIAVISSQMDFPIHDYPFDYWRFTPTAFRSLLKPFAACFVGFAGKASFPHTVVGVGFKGEPPDLSPLKRDYHRWQTRQRRDLRRVVKQATPPVLWPALGQAHAAWTGLKKAMRRDSTGRNETRGMP